MQGWPEHRRRGRRPWVRIAQSVALAAGIVAAIGAGLIGCGDSGAQYRVLSVFFEGVPKPGQESVPPTGGAPGGVVAAPPQPAIFYHAAYENRLCLPCHSEPGYQVSPAKTACGACHKAYFQVQSNEWQHGPVAVGQCGFCHLPHTSPYPHLLTRPVPDLCFQCHDRHTLAKPYHATTGNQSCTACHDSHMAGNRKLMIDADGRKRRHALATRPAGGLP